MGATKVTLFEKAAKDRPFCLQSAPFCRMEEVSLARSKIDGSYVFNRVFAVNAALKLEIQALEQDVESAMRVVARLRREALQLSYCPVCVGPTCTKGAEFLCPKI